MNDKPKSVIEVTGGDGYQIWSMQFAPVNALSPALLRDLRQLVEAAAKDPDVAVVVLASGLRLFSAGGDATWMGQVVAKDGVDGLVEQFSALMDEFRELCIAIRRSPVLVVAALNGHTLAGGLELAAACDLRFASNFPKIQIGVPEMDLFGAMPTGGGGSQFLARILGPSRALEFILEAKPVDPATALAMGLVDRLYEPDDLLPKTVAFAGSVAAKAGRVGVAAAKRSILGGWEIPLHDAMELDRSLHWDSIRRGNFHKGAEDFVRRFASGS